MSASAASPLTELLHSTKAARLSMLSDRDYEAVKKLRQQCFDQAEEIKSGLHTDTIAKHETERRRLAKARESALQEAHERVVAELSEIEQQWDDRRSGFDARQQQRFEQAARSIRNREESKPIVLSSYVRDLQQSEAKLASLHQYDEAAQVRRKIQRLEDQERIAAEAAKEDRIQRALDITRRAIEQDDRNFRAKVKNELQLALSRARREEDRVKSKFEHIERDMRHAHSLELRKNPLQAPYERPSFIRPRRIESNADQSIFLPESSQSAASAAQRGTEYLRRTQGSKLCVDSLCDLYCNGVPDHLTNAGNKLRLGSDPTSPQRLDRRGVIDLTLPPVS